MLYLTSDQTVAPKLCEFKQSILELCWRRNSLAGAIRPVYGSARRSLLPVHQQAFRVCSVTKKHRDRQFLWGENERKPSAEIFCQTDLRDEPVMICANGKIKNQQHVLLFYISCSAARLIDPVWTSAAERSCRQTSVCSSQKLNRVSVDGDTSVRHLNHFRVGWLINLIANNVMFIHIYIFNIYFCCRNSLSSSSQ